MTQRGSLAFAHARVRAWKGRLLRRADILALFGSKAVPFDEDPFAALLKLYRLLIHLYPAHAPVFRALLRLHEIENVKLGWRAIVRHIDNRRWAPLWLRFGPLASVDPDMVRHSPRDFAAALEKTPYGTIAGRVLHAHGDDLAAAEMAFDRWATADVLRSAEAMTGIARRLVESVVRERDAQLIARRGRAYAVLSKEPEDVFAIRRERLVLCRRAFIGDAFQIAPAIAVLLLYEEQLRGLTALVERRGDDSLDPIIAQQLASSLMGAT